MEQTCLICRWKSGRCGSGAGGGAQCARRSSVGSCASCTGSACEQRGAGCSGGREVRRVRRRRQGDPLDGGHSAERRGRARREDGALQRVRTRGPPDLPRLHDQHAPLGGRLRLAVNITFCYFAFKFWVFSQTVAQKCILRWLALVQVWLFISYRRIGLPNQKLNILICIILSYTKLVCWAIFSCVRKSLMHMLKSAIFPAEFWKNFPAPSVFK